MQHLILGESNNEIYRARNILFFYNNKYFLVSSWLSGYDSDCDFILDLIQKNNQKSRQKEIDYPYEVSKSNRLESDFRNSGNDFIAATKKAVYETNYIYYDNAGKRYAVQSQKPYTEAILNATDLYDEIDKCKDMLTRFKLDYLIESAEDLLRANIVYDIKDRKYLQKTEEIIKYINNQ